MSNEENIRLGLNNNKNIIEKNNIINKDYNYEEERIKTEQKVKDLIEINVKFELFPLSEHFKMEKFYNKIVYFTSDEEKFQFEWYLNNGFIEKLSDLCKRIRHKAIKKRTIGGMSFYLNNDFSIDVDCFLLASYTTKPSGVYVESQSNRILQVLNKKIDKTTSEVIYDKDIGNYIPYGNRKVPFSREDINKIKSIETPSIRLIGFKSISKLKPYYQVSKSYFIFPNETKSSGGGKVFDALIKQMTIKKKYALVKFTPREGSNMRLCTLIPQIESFDEDHFQTPGGFHLIPLPFGEELRSNDDLFEILQKKYQNGSFSFDLKALSNPINEKKISEGMGKLKELIQKLTIENFSVRLFEKYYLQKFYSSLEALALKEKDIQEVVDSMEVPNERYDEMRDMIIEINEKFFLLNEYDENGDKVIFKKKKNDNLINKKVKESKYLEAVLYNQDLSYYNNERLRQLKEEGNFDKLKVDLLKNICKMKGINITKSTKKCDIIQLLSEFEY